MSEALGTAKIAAALADFQADMPAVSKNKKAEVPTKTGGKYTYTYADLADVSAQAMPLLRKNGLAFSACPRRTEHGYELVGLLLHVSGETLQGALPLNGNQPQEIGSALTYARRYLLGCMTGLVTDDDDDGQAAQPARRTEQKITAKTRGEMFALFGQKGIAEDRQLAGINQITGAGYESRADVTEAHAKEVIRSLRTRPDAEIAPSAQPADRAGDAGAGT